MKRKLALLLSLIHAPRAGMHAADKPDKPNPDQFAGVDPDDGTAPRPEKMLPPRLIPNPNSTEDDARAKLTCTSVPSIAVSRGGRIWAMWYSGTTPGEIIERCPNAYSVLSTSGDGGRTWKEVLAIDPDGAGPLKAFDPQPWVDPDGKLWVIWHHTGVKHAWAITADDAEQENPAWSPPRIITSGVMMDKPAILSKDDGKTWSAGLMLDDRNGISYPDGQQTADGTIHLIWDFSRSKEQEIFMTTFREEDVLAANDEAAARVKTNRKLVSKGGTP